MNLCFLNCDEISIAGPRISCQPLTDRSSFSMFILKVLFQKSIQCSLEILPLMQLKMN